MSHDQPESQEPKSICQYFVDEAGDPVLFNRRKQVVIGQDGCSHYFIMGVLHISETERFSQALTQLRMELLADPYFKQVPSMQPQGQKTAVAFHAKDDVPEVRREVFRLLLQHEMRFQAVVRDKQAVLSYVRQCNERDPAYRYQQNELYDSLVRRLFKNLLHKAEAYRVCFARRGSSDRTAALRAALEHARRNFNLTRSKVGSTPVEAVSGWPPQHPALQAVDYFLWALQRLYERQEDRYLELVWPKVSLVHDVDDTRQKKYGAYYDQRRSLTLIASQR